MTKRKKVEVPLLVPERIHCGNFPQINFLYKQNRQSWLVSAVFMAKLPNTQLRYISFTEGPSEPDFTDTDSASWLRLRARFLCRYESRMLHQYTAPSPTEQ